MNSESLAALKPITSNFGSFYRLKEGGTLVLFSSDGKFMLIVKHDDNGQLVASSGCYSTKTTDLRDGNKYEIVDGHIIDMLDN